MYPSPLRKILRSKWTALLVTTLCAQVNIGAGSLKEAWIQIEDPNNEAPIIEAYNKGETSEKASTDPKAEVIFRVLEQTSCQRSCDIQLNACRLDNAAQDEVCTSKKNACDAQCPAVQDLAELTNSMKLIDNPFIDPALSIPTYTCPNKELVPAASNASYIILTRPMFLDALQPFIQVKTRAGERVQTVLVDAILCGERGADVQEKIRSFLKRTADARTPSKDLPAVLIVGAPRRSASTLNSAYVDLGKRLVEPWEVPIRYIRQGGPATPTDQYYASVSQPWSADFRQHLETDPVIYDFNFDYQFLVGRIPVRSSADVEHWAAKTLAWRTPSQFTESRFSTIDCVQHTDQSGSDWDTRSTHRVIQHPCTEDRGGDIADYANVELPDLITSYSHGSYEGITYWPSDYGFTLTNNSPGFTKAPILFVHGCEVGGLDYPTPSLTETTLAREDGSVAVIAASRSHIDNKFPFVRTVFNEGKVGLGDAFYSTKQAMAKRMLNYTVVDELYMYNLYGDPKLTIVSPSFKTSVTPARSTIYTDPAVFNEPVSVPVTVTSYASEEAHASLVHNRTNAPIIIPASRTVATTLSTQTANEESQYLRTPMSVDYYPYTSRPIILALDKTGGCQTDRQSCIASRLRIAPLIDISCAKHRPFRTYNEQTGDLISSGYQFPFKVHGSTASIATRGPFTVTAKIIPGRYYPDNTRGSDIENPAHGQIVAQTTYSSFTLNQLYTLQSTTIQRIPVAEEYTTEREGSSYYGSQSFLEVRDRDNALVSFCRYGLTF